MSCSSCTPTPEVRLCAYCQKYRRYTGETCQECGKDTDRTAYLVQAVLVYCDDCKQRRLHHIKSDTLIVCGFCLIFKPHPLASKP